MSDSNIYACVRCGGIDCKLWRSYSTFDPNLKCLDCARITANPSAVIEDDFAADGSRPRPNALPDAPYMAKRSWEIEWYIPAVPAASTPGAYWSYGTIPMDPRSPDHGDWLAWVALPLRPAL